MRRINIFTNFVIFIIFGFLVIPFQALAEEPEIKTETKMYYYHQDHLGGTGVVTNEAGEPVQILDYYPYGETRIDEQADGFDSESKYTGQKLDGESGIYYYNARYYNQDIGRFLSQDPAAFMAPERFLTDPQQLNLYSYARNNPIIFLDPLGLSTATYNPVPKGGWSLNDEMGQFNGVTAYYNGIGSSREVSSCVEYAKRYMSKKYGINNIGVVGDAAGMWGMVDTINQNLENAGSSYTFTKYNNNEGFVLPQEGDLLFWTEGTWGHVMVVTESGFDESTGKGYVEVIDQNASNQAVRSYDVVKTETGYQVMKNETTPMAGWFRPVDNSAPAEPPAKSEPVAQAPAQEPQPQPRPSFFQRAWNTAKRFFRNIFGD